MNDKKVAIIGGKGAALVIGTAVNNAYKNYNYNYRFIGLLNDRYEDKIEGYPVLGALDDICKLIDDDFYFINTLFKIGGQDERINIFKSLNIPKERLCTFIHPQSYVADNVKIGSGSVVMPNASISSGTTIGNNTLVMSNCSIGHNNEIGDFCFLTANSCLGSYIRIKQGVWIGLNSTIRGKLTIGSKAAIGIGSVVTKSIPEEELWIGNPASFHKSVKSEDISM